MFDKIQLQINSILHVPFQNYEKDFTFNVNGQKYLTNRIIADILSPTISKYHINDPTFNEFEINTDNPGNFQIILNLLNFEETNILENEKPFVHEIAEILENSYLKFILTDKEITFDNVFNDISIHEQKIYFFREIYEKEIDFISENFYQIDEEQEEMISQLSEKTIERILNNPNLQLDSEDQLLSFVNKLYLNDKKNSFFYEYIDFLNINLERISEFLEIFNINDITNQLWLNISSRLNNRIIIKNNSTRKRGFQRKVHKKRLLFENKYDNFDGILNYLREESNGNIDDEVVITSSSVTQEARDPRNVVLYEDQKRWFCSKDEEDSWICFDFKKNKVAPTEYTLRSFSNVNAHHPREWVIEGSDDCVEWKIIDQERNCSFLNGASLVHTFQIKNENYQDFRYIRMRQTDRNWIDHYNFLLDSFEIFGELSINCNEC